MLNSLFGRFPSQLQAAYQKILKPDAGLLGVVIGLAIADTAIFLISEERVFNLIEILVSLSLTIAASWLASRILKQFFDVYFLDVVLASERQLDSQLFYLAKLLGNLLIILLAIVIFAITHKINIFGLVASLGIAGLAVALLAHNILEQLLGGLTLYLDPPFAMNDYIGLPDGTFGRVESMGWRSTKLRTSDKGTLMVVPNNSLTQVSIENFTGTKKVKVSIDLNFYPAISHEEQAAIRQTLLDSTNEIFGIDIRSTNVTFRDFTDGEQNKTQAQMTFFIVIYSNVSTGLWRQILTIASESIRESLKDYGAIFDIEEPKIDIDSSNNW